MILFVWASPSFDDWDVSNEFKCLHWESNQRPLALFSGVLDNSAILIVDELMYLKL